MDGCFLCLRVRFLLLPPSLPNPGSLLDEEALVRPKLAFTVDGGLGLSAGVGAGVGAGAGVEAGAAGCGLYDKPTESCFLGPVVITAG